MEIKIITNGPWIIKMYEDGYLLDKDEASHLYNYITNFLTTTQYPDLE